MAKRRLQSLWLFLVLLFLYAPILLLAVYSFTDAAMIGSIRSFSLHNYVSLFTMEELRDMILGTLVLTLAVAVISTLLGTLGAVGAFYAGGKKKRVMDLFNQIPVVNADVVTGFSVCVLMIVLLEVDKSTYLPLVVGPLRGGAGSGLYAGGRPAEGGVSPDCSRRYLGVSSVCDPHAG